MLEVGAGIVGERERRGEGRRRKKKKKKKKRNGETSDSVCVVLRGVMMRKVQKTCVCQTFVGPVGFEPTHSMEYQNLSLAP